MDNRFQNQEKYIRYIAFFAARLEFGREQILNFISSQALKYVKRENELPSTRIFKEAFEIDKALYHDGYRSCYSFYQKIMSDFNIKDLDDIDVSRNIHDKSVVKVSEQLSSINEANKLYTYSQIYKNFTCQTYLSFGLSKTVTKELSKLRISAHDLMIKRGGYFRPVIPRNQRVRLNCEQVEDEIHFMLFCSKFKDLRILFRRLNIHTHDLRSNTIEVFSVFSKLLNPTNVKETKYICNYILPMQ